MVSVLVLGLIVFSLFRDAHPAGRKSVPERFSFRYGVVSHRIDQPSFRHLSADRRFFYRKLLAS